MAAILILSACAGKPERVEPEPKKPIGYSNFLSPEAEDLIRRGVSSHDRGNYDTALDFYNRAMELAPDHPIIYYEMGFSRIAMSQADVALGLAEKGLAVAKERNYREVIPTLLDLKGSALYNLNRNEEAIAVYQQAINEFGVSNTFLYYNMAASYYNLNRREEAVDSLIKGLLINRNHASSNYLLGKICMEDGKKAQAFYPLCYFLLMEPNTTRAAQSYNTIRHMLGRAEEGGARNNGSFTAADTVISNAFVLDEENARRSDAEKIRAKLSYVFTSIEDQINSGRISRSAGDELWWDFYSPFFYRIAQSQYLGTFTRYIGLSADPDADKWIENGRDEIEGFFNWLNTYME